MLREGLQAAGSYTVNFDGTALPNGLYLVRLTVRPENGATAHTYTERITLAR